MGWKADGRCSEGERKEEGKKRDKMGWKVKGRRRRREGGGKARKRFAPGVKS